VDLTTAPPTKWLSASKGLAEVSTRMAALRWAAGTLLGNPDPQQALAYALWSLYSEPNLPPTIDEPLDFRGTRFFLADSRPPAPVLAVLAVLRLLERPGVRDQGLKRQLGLPIGLEYKGP
jgi:hypothetical protein